MKCTAGVQVSVALPFSQAKPPAEARQALRDASKHAELKSVIGLAKKRHKRILPLFLSEGSSVETSLCPDDLRMNKLVSNIGFHLHIMLLDIFLCGGSARAPGPPVHAGRPFERDVKCV